MGEEVHYATAIVSNNDNRIISIDYGEGTHKFGYALEAAHKIVEEHNAQYHAHHYRWVVLKITTNTEIVG